MPAGRQSFPALRLQVPTIVFVLRLAMGQNPCLRSLFVKYHGLAPDYDVYIHPMSTSIRYLDTTFSTFCLSRTRIPIHQVEAYLGGNVRYVNGVLIHASRTYPTS